MSDFECVTWFDSLVAPKHLEATGNTVRCEIGFNRPITANGITRIIGETIEVEAVSIIAALKDAKIQYEFLATNTCDILDSARSHNTS